MEQNSNQSTEKKKIVTIDFNRETVQTIKRIENDVTMRASVYGQYDPVYEMELLHYVRHLRKTLKFLSEFVSDDIVEIANKKLNKGYSED
jgi:predicted choloylglycine hydrolase